MISIITVTYNNFDDLYRTLNSLEKVKGIETYSGQKTIEEEITVTADDVKLVIKEVLGVDLMVENINV